MIAGCYKVEAILNSYSLGRLAGDAGLLEPCSMKTVQTSEFRPAQIKPRMHFTNIWYLQSFCCLETTVLKNKRSFFFTLGKHYKTWREIFSSKAYNNCISFPVDNSNVELTKHSTYGGGQRSAPIIHLRRRRAGWFGSAAAERRSSSIGGSDAYEYSAVAAFGGVQ